MDKITLLQPSQESVIGALVHILFARSHKVGKTFVVQPPNFKTLSCGQVVLVVELKNLLLQIKKINKSLCEIINNQIKVRRTGPCSPSSSSSFSFSLFPQIKSITELKKNPSKPLRDF